jgi:hypothetical protein
MALSAASTGENFNDLIRTQRQLAHRFMAIRENYFYENCFFDIFHVHLRRAISI